MRILTIHWLANGDSEYGHGCIFTHKKEVVIKGSECTLHRQRRNKSAPSIEL